MADSSNPDFGAVLDDIRRSPTFDALSRNTVHTARRLAAADGATFVLRDDDKCFYVDEDAAAALWKGQRFPITECISGWAMLNAEPAQVPDIWLDSRIPREAYAPTFVRSLAMVPMGTSEPRGAVGVYWSRPGRTLGQPELHLLLELAAEAGRAVDRLGLDAAPWAPTLGQRGHNRV